MSRPKIEPDVMELHLRVCENGYLVTAIYDNPEWDDPEDAGFKVSSVPKKIVKRFIAPDSGNVGRRVEMLASALCARQVQNGQD